MFGVLFRAVCCMLFCSAFCSQRLGVHCGVLFDVVFGFRVLLGVSFGQVCLERLLLLWFEKKRKIKIVAMLPSCQLQAQCRGPARH